MNTPESPALTIPEFATTYGLKESWVRKALRPGKPLAELHHRAGKHVRFTEDDCRGFEALTAAGANNSQATSLVAAVADGEEIAPGLSLREVNLSIMRLAKTRQTAA